MRTTVMAAIVLILTAPNLYGLEVTEVFIDGGQVLGHWELTVTNNEALPVYVLAVGNYVAHVHWNIHFWGDELVSSSQWDAGFAFSAIHADATAPNTAATPFATLFPGYSQALVFWASTHTSSHPIAVGITRNGYRYQVRPVAGDGQASRLTGSPFVAFGADGEVLATGVTTEPSVPVEEKTWGAIKALFE